MKTSRRCRGALSAFVLAAGLLPAGATSPAAAAHGDDQLAQLRVAPEAPRAGYRRELFPHWVDGDGDGRDTREEVLIRQSSTPPQVDPYGCRVLAGDWTSRYDGVRTTDPADLEVDHVVALAEAWDSGAAGWTTERRRAFANDVDRPELLAVSRTANQAKSDSDPAQWLPSRREVWCQYARDWIAVKTAWDLSADQAEVDALRRLFVSCPAEP